MANPLFSLRVPPELLTALQQVGNEQIKALLTANYLSPVNTKPVNTTPPPLLTDLSPNVLTVEDKVQELREPVGFKQATKPVSTKLDIAAMVQANEAKMQAKKNRLGLTNGLKTQ